MGCVSSAQAAPSEASQPQTHESSNRSACPEPARPAQETEVSENSHLDGGQPISVVAPNGSEPGPVPHSSTLDEFTPSYIDTAEPQTPSHWSTPSNMDRDVDPISPITPLHDDGSVNEPVTPTTDTLDLKYSDLTLLEHKGSGTFGDVFLGTLWGDEVAIKRMNLDCAEVENPEEMRDLLIHEINIMKSLRHRNIVRYMGACIEFPNLCIVTEYVANGSLEQLLNETKRLSMHRYLNIAIGITKGLNWLHHQHVIHRDLKPSNVLVDQHEEVKICDFGISHKKQSKKTPGRYGKAGTLCYMAPEVMDEEYGVKADIYSLGIILCQMTTGFLPYSVIGLDETSDSFIENVKEGFRPAIASKENEALATKPFLLNADVPEPLKRLIEQCWDPDPEKRPAADVVLDRLKNIKKQLDGDRQTFEETDLHDLPTDVQALIRDNTVRIRELELARKKTEDERANQERHAAMHIRLLERELQKMERDLIKTKTKVKKLEGRNRVLMKRNKKLLQLGDNGSPRSASVTKSAKKRKTKTKKKTSKKSSGDHPRRPRSQSLANLADASAPSSPAPSTPARSTTGKSIARARVLELLLREGARGSGTLDKSQAPKQSSPDRPMVSFFANASPRHSIVADPGTPSSLSGRNSWRRGSGPTATSLRITSEQGAVNLSGELGLSTSFEDFPSPDESKHESPPAVARHADRQRSKPNIRDLLNPIADIQNQNEVNGSGPGLPPSMSLLKDSLSRSRVSFLKTPVQTQPAEEQKENPVASSIPEE